jgi:hypothetical protein
MNRTPAERAVDFCAAHEGQYGTTEECQADAERQYALKDQEDADVTARPRPC